MGAVNIPSPSGASYAVYGDLPSAKVYLAGAIGPGPDAWNALVAASNDTVCSQLLVAAYRYLERQAWNPTTAPDTPTRSGILAFQQAEYELAAIFAADTSVNSATDQGSNVMTLRAGPVMVEYFRPTSAAAGTATKLPQVLMDLIGPYLYAVNSGVGVTYYSSNCADDTRSNGSIDDTESSFTADAQYTRNEPF